MCVNERGRCNPLFTDSRGRGGDGIRGGSNTRVVPGWGHCWALAGALAGAPAGGDNWRREGRRVGGPLGRCCLGLRTTGYLSRLRFDTV